MKPYLNIYFNRIFCFVNNFIDLNHREDYILVHRNIEWQTHRLKLRFMTVTPILPSNK